MISRPFLIACACLIVYCASAQANSAIEAAARVDDRSWAKRHAELQERVSSSDPELVFVGDSITHFWEVTGKSVWRGEYSNARALNLGVSGDRTEHVLWRLDHMPMERLSPKAVVLLIGTNNVFANTAEEIASGVAANVHALNKLWPDATVVLLGVFPRADVDEDHRQKLKRVNETIGELGNEVGVRYLDIGAVFLEADGSINRDVMWDYLHLTQEGYRRWAAALAPVLAELLGHE